MKRYFFVMLLAAYIASANAAQALTNDNKTIKQVQCRLAQTWASVDLIKKGQAQAGNQNFIPNTYSVTLAFGADYNSAEKHTLIGSGNCFFARGVNPRAFSCSDGQANANNMISTNIFGADGPGFALEMWGIPANLNSNLNTDPADEPLAGITGKLQVNPPDAAGRVLLMFPYVQQVVPINDNSFGYCSLTEE